MDLYAPIGGMLKAMSRAILILAPLALLGLILGMVEAARLAVWVFHHVRWH